MERSLQILRLEIEGQWSASEFGQALMSISNLYDLRLFLEMLREDEQDWERFYDEMIHFPPFRQRWKNRRRYFGAVPWMAGLPGSTLPLLDDSQLSRISLLIEPAERLEVRRIRYSSPGVADLAGIGTVVGHLKDFIVRLIERHNSKRQRELGDERAALENDRIRLENARNFVALGRDLGYSETDLRRLVVHVDEKQETVIRLIDQQKLRSASTETKEG